MSTTIKVLGGLAAGALVVLGGFFVAARVGSARQARRVDTLLEPVARALRERRTPEPDTVQALARDPLTRNALGELLDSAGRLDLFPPEFQHPIPIATSDMVYWLVHPHELGTTPDEIENTARVLINAGPEIGDVVYFVFRFRMHEPHWAAKDGWMAGVAGPYRLEGERIVLRGSATFSRFVGYDTQTPEEHVRSIHDEAVRRGLLKGFVRQPATGAA